MVGGLASRRAAPAAPSSSARPRVVLLLKFKRPPALLPTAAIFGVYVSPLARDYGIASALTELAIDRAAEFGRRRVVLQS